MEFKKSSESENEFTYKVVEDYGELGDRGNGGEKMGKRIQLTEKECEKLLELLRKIKEN